MSSDGQKAVSRIRKTARYQQLDDFAVIGTPPTGGDGPLFSNILGKLPMPRAESTYDRINRELSLAEEPSLSSNTKTNSFSNPICASLSVGLSGICLKPTEETAATLPEQNFIVPSATDNSLPHKLIVTKPRARKISHFETKHIDQNALLEVFNELKSLREENSTVITAPVLPVVEPASVVLPRQRKVSAPPALGPGYLMDSNKSSMTNFFFNGGLTSFCNKMGNSSHSDISENSIVPAINTDQKTSLSGSTVTPNSTTPVLAASPPMSPSIENKKVVKRRLKKNTFREMNLWAPQSM